MKLENKKIIICIIFTIVISTLISTIITTYLVKDKSQKILSIDLEKIIKQFVAEESQKNISPEQKRKHIVNFSKALNNVIANDLSENKVVLVKQAVLSGGKDITASVYSHVQKKLKMEGNNNEAE